VQRPIGQFVTGCSWEKVFSRSIGRIAYRAATTSSLSSSLSPATCRDTGDLKRARFFSPSSHRLRSFHFFFFSFFPFFFVLAFFPFLQVSLSLSLSLSLSIFFFHSLSSVLCLDMVNLCVFLSLSFPLSISTSSLPRADRRVSGVGKVREFVIVWSELRLCRSQSREIHAYDVNVRS